MGFSHLALLCVLLPSILESQYGSQEDLFKTKSYHVPPFTSLHWLLFSFRVKAHLTQWHERPYIIWVFVTSLSLSLPSKFTALQATGQIDQTLSCLWPLKHRFFWLEYTRPIANFLSCQVFSQISPTQWGLPWHMYLKLQPGPIPSPPLPLTLLFKKVLFIAFISSAVLRHLQIYTFFYTFLH